MNSLNEEETKEEEETAETDEKPLDDKDLDRLSEIITELTKADGDKAEKKEIMDKLIVFFRETGRKSYRTKDLVIRFVDDRDTLSFDIDMLKDKYPAIWKECHKVHHRDANVNIHKISGIPAKKAEAK
jgi:uncharacterized protein YwqG